MLLVVEWLNPKEPREWTLKIEGKLMNTTEDRIIQQQKRFLSFFKKI